MRLVFEPQSDLIGNEQAVELAITVDSKGRPEVYRPADSTPPDRHFLLAMAQSLQVAAEERDADMVEFHPHFVLELEIAAVKDELTPKMALVRFQSGRMACVSQVDPEQTVKLLRQVVRYFTGAVRLDVP